MPKLSVIICTYNREKYLYNCLKSIAENDFSPEHEIVLVNNNSTDNTENECVRFQNDYPQVVFRYFLEKNQGLSFARNRGIDEATGDVLVYVDDDAKVGDNYLKTIAGFLGENPRAMAVGGAIFPVYETQEPNWMSHYTRILITAYKNEGKKVIEFKRGKFPSGGNAAFRKEVFQQIGKFNTELGRIGNSLLSAEEKDVFDRMRQKKMPIFYLPQMVLYHIIPPSRLTKEYFYRLTSSIGKSERLRTLNISKAKYAKRLLAELVKWAATLALCTGFLLKLQPRKGWKLIQFRWFVTKGLVIN
ncbi:MAG: glycosyltransferase [Bacteroidales bacterium]|jgi:glycosyltransferase involved in cell wall biosynthesis|nr:glycosyltransferase [Bacteroidales bacterium]